MFIVVIHVTRDENTGNLKPNRIWIELAYNNTNGQHNQHHFLILNINESWSSKFNSERNIIVIKSDGSDIYMKGEPREKWTLDISHARLWTRLGLSNTVKIVSFDAE